jgi:hypothetical protein
MLKQKLSPYAFCGIILVTGLFDTIRIDRLFVHVVNPMQFIVKDKVIDELRSGMDREPFRCFFLPGAFGQNAEGIYGLEGIGDFHDNELLWFRAFRGDQGRNFFQDILAQDGQGNPYLNVGDLPNGNNFLNLANVRYYVSRQGGRVVKLENQGALGRVSFVSGYMVMKEGDIAEALLMKRYDIRSTVALLEEPAEKPVPPDFADSLAADAPLMSAAWEKYTTNYRKVKITAPRDGFLRISEVYYPGWEIVVDGVKTKILRADLAWMAVPVKKGEHIVEMRPKSLYLAKASMVSFPLIAILLGYWIIIVAMKMRNRQSIQKAA